MRNYLSFFLLILTFSCNVASRENVNMGISKSDKNQKNKSIHSEQIIGERINGPANIRDKPNGEVLFELYDNTLVEATQLKDDWYQVLVNADIKYEEFGLDSIRKGRFLISNGDTIGKIVKTHYVSTGQGKDESYAMVYGFTHKNNIKPETVIENALKKEISKNQRNYSSWTNFIRSFELSPNAFNYDKFETYYNYENSIEDPSPGFRIVLLFQTNKLIGFIHSRQLNIDNTSTHKLDYNYYISFFNEFSQKEQSNFVNYMNEWIKGVD